MSDTQILGTCPKCKGNVILGKYGPYCESKCGFRVGKPFGKELSTDEVIKILAGKEILLKDVESKKKAGLKYSVYIKMTGIHEYEYTRPDGTEVHGYNPDFERRFPDRKENGTTQDSSEQIPDFPLDITDQ